MGRNFGPRFRSRARPLFCQTGPNQSRAGTDGSSAKACHCSHAARVGRLDVEPMQHGQHRRGLQAGAVVTDRHPRVRTLLRGAFRPSRARHEKKPQSVPGLELRRKTPSRATGLGCSRQLATRRQQLIQFRREAERPVLLPASFVSTLVFSRPTQAPGPLGLLFARGLSKVTRNVRLRGPSRAIRNVRLVRPVSHWCSANPACSA